MPDSGIPAGDLAKSGPIRFDEFVELALYHPDSGFYSRRGGPSLRRDFLTSPGVGPLFGAVLAQALDTWWRDLGAPEVFHVIEAGAGDGSLARSIVAAAPACLPALRYTLVERPPFRFSALESVNNAPFQYSERLPAGAHDGVVLANELLDNLPFRLLARTGDTFRDIAPECVPSSGWGWGEVWVAVDTGPREVLVPARADVAAEADRLAPDAPPNTRIPLQHQAADWLRAALATVRRGRVVVIDYCDTTPNLAERPWAQWVRTYRANGPGAPPLEDLGLQDITCEVALDQLAGVRRPTTNTTQAEFLRAHGIDDLVDRARQEWHARAHVGDLVALKHKSRLTEAAALTDPAGLGAFRVLEWVVSNP